MYICPSVHHLFGLSFCLGVVAYLQLFSCIAGVFYVRPFCCFLPVPIAFVLLLWPSLFVFVVVVAAFAFLVNNKRCLCNSHLLLLLFGSIQVTNWTPIFEVSDRVGIRE